MASYGRDNAYFGTRPKGFINSTWIELIGFDNVAPDLGVEDYLDKLGFIPDIVSFHLSSIDVVNTHLGMEQEYKLPVYACSYAGHTHNDDRERQDWTNWDLKKLVVELHKRGIRVYSSFFDLENHSGRDYIADIFTDNHPELRCVDRDGRQHTFIYMIKRFADGTPYIDYMLPRLIQLTDDYGLDGIQLADGLSSPRMSLEQADYSDDIVERFLAALGLTLPEGMKLHCTESADFRKRADWIYSQYRREWRKFITQEWSLFMTTCIRALRNHGKEAAFNSAWTKDPLESLYRYAADYKAYEVAGANNFVVEDVSADLFICAEEENGYHMGYTYRKFIHYEFLANLMCNKAMMPNLPLTPLSMIRDTLEQWDVIHHMPTAMQRATATNLNNFLQTDQGLVPVTNGPWFCLADGLTKTEWRDIRLSWDNGYTSHIKAVPGFTILWSDERMWRELEEIYANRGWHTAKWLAELLSKGAPVHKIAPMQYFGNISGPLLVPNPGLMSESELAKVYAYQNGPVVYIGILPETISVTGALISSESAWQRVSMLVVQNSSIGNKTFYDTTQRPTHMEALPELQYGLWTHPLRYHPVAEGFVSCCAEALSRLCAYPLVEGDHDATNILQVEIDEYTDRFLIDNDEYFYILPTLHVNRDIEKVVFLTKPIGYPAQVTDRSVRFRVPGRGMDVLEITYRK
jgi:hypothetical protein